jgi:hypothetical protein
MRNSKTRLASVQVAALAGMVLQLGAERTAQVVVEVYDVSTAALLDGFEGLNLSPLVKNMARKPIEGLTAAGRERVREWAVRTLPQLAARTPAAPA